MSHLFLQAKGTAVMDAINKAGTTREPYPTQDSLFFKIQGAPEVVSKAAEAMKVIVKKHSGSRFEFASTEEYAKEMWENRKMALFSSLQLEPKLRCWTTDVWFVPGTWCRDPWCADRGLAFRYPASLSWCTKRRGTSLSMG